MAASARALQLFCSPFGQHTAAAAAHHQVGGGTAHRHSGKALIFLRNIPMCGGRRREVARVVARTHTRTFASLCLFGVFRDYWLGCLMHVYCMRGSVALWLWLLQRQILPKYMVSLCGLTKARRHNATWLWTVGACTIRMHCMKTRARAQ